MASTPINLLLRFDVLDGFGSWNFLSVVRISILQEHRFKFGRWKWWGATSYLSVREGGRGRNRWHVRSALFLQLNMECFNYSDIFMIVTKSFPQYLLSIFYSNTQPKNHPCFRLIFWWTSSLGILPVKLKITITFILFILYKFLNHPQNSHQISYHLKA